MGHCSARGCKNHSGYAPVNVTFHRFPRDETLRKQWTAAMGRPDWVPTRWSCVCSIHFRESDLDKTSLSRVRIKEGAVPTIFTALSSPLQAEMAKDPSNEGMSSEQDHFSKLESSLEEGSRINEENMIEQSMNTSICDEGEKEIQKQEKVNSKISEMYTPQKLKLKGKIEKLTKINKMKTKKINLLQQKCCWEKKQSAKMKNIISELRKEKLLDEDTVDILERVGGASKEILKCQIAKVKRHPSSNKYAEELRSFAVTLYFYSKAYNYVRTTFGMYLPHPQTLCQ